MDDDDALKALKLRYTKGEISRKNYLQMKADVEGNKASKVDEEATEENNSGKDKSKTKKRNVMIGWVVIIVIAVILAVLILANKTNNPSPYTSTAGYSTIPQVYSLTLLSQGQVFSINPGSSYGINFTIPQGSYSVNVSGSYTSQGKVEVAILTPAQYGAFSQNPSSLESSRYYYGDTQGSTINAYLSAGQYTLVFYDPGIITQDTVTVVNLIIAKYTN